MGIQSLVEVGKLASVLGSRLNAHVVSQLPAVRVASVVAVLSIGDSVVGDLAAHGPRWWPALPSGRLCIVMLLGGDLALKKCSASPRAAGGACPALRFSLR